MKLVWQAFFHRLHICLCIIRAFLYSQLSHYEAKLCILYFVNGIRNRPKSDLLRNPQHFLFSLMFFDVLDTTNKHLKYCTAQNRSKNRQFCGIRNFIWGSKTVCGIHKQIRRHVYSYMELLRNPQLQAESANCTRSPQIVNGIRKL